jgi:hypothetical protein
MDFDLSFALLNAGSSIDASMAMMAITTSSSINVNPVRRTVCFFSLIILSIFFNKLKFGPQQFLHYEPNEPNLLFSISGQINDWRIASMVHQLFVLLRI